MHDIVWFKAVYIHTATNLVLQMISNGYTTLTMHHKKLNVTYFSCRNPRQYAKLTWFISWIGAHCAVFDIVDGSIHYQQQYWSSSSIWHMIHVLWICTCTLSRLLNLKWKDTWYIMILGCIHPHCYQYCVTDDIKWVYNNNDALEKLNVT